MQENTAPQQISIEPEKLGVLGTIGQVFMGIGIMLGLGLLWTLESVRNVAFRLFDRLNIKPRSRKRRISAFPPGMPRRRKAI